MRPSRVPGGRRVVPVRRVDQAWVRFGRQPEPGLGQPVTGAARAGVSGPAFGSESGDPGTLPSRMREVQRILVCGYYGFANTGDEAILAALITDLRKVHPAAEVTVMSGHPAGTHADHGVAAIHWQDIAAMVESAREADLMVLGGGGLFQDQHGFDETQTLTPEHGGIGYYAGFALLAPLTRTPLVIYGVGVGPLNTEIGRHWTRIAFRHATATSVRDEGSLALLCEIGVDTSGIAVTADPAWALQSSDGNIAESILTLEEVAEASKTVAVAVRPWGDDYGWADPLAGALDRLVDELDARVLFVPFQDSPRPHENDPHAAVEVFRRMRRNERASIIRGMYSVEERAALIASSDLLVGMRLHSIIFGLAADVPTVAIAYDPKVSQAMADMDRAELSTPLDELTADWVVASSRTAMELGPALAAEDMRRRALANYRVLEGTGTVPEASVEARAAVSELLLAQAATHGVRTSEIRRLRNENARIWQQYEHERAAHRRAYEALAQQLEDLVNTKAVRAANAYWGLRETIRGAIRELGKRAPESIRPRLKKMVGGYRDPGPPQPPAEVDQDMVAAAVEQVEEVLERHRDVPGIVVYPPSIGWNTSLFQRPQQMALAFAKLGYLVFYGVDEREGIGDLIEPRAERVYLYPVSWAMLEAVGRIPRPITPSYVYNFSWTRKLSDPRVIFEHIDELEVFTTTHTIEDLGVWYDEAVEEAEVVVASARDLMGSVKPRRPDVFLCPNGVDYQHFAGVIDPDPPDDIVDIAGNGRPIVGYYGALAEWVDYPLIRKTATELSDFEFVFIGPDYDGSIKEHTEVFGLPNVRWLGVKPYAELPAYLHWFDVATIPFVVSEVTHSVSPIKLFEYMAGGRPVVTPNLRECTYYEAVQIASDADGYVARLREAALVLRHDQDHQALLRRTARANTWEMRVGSLIDALARAGRL